MTERFYWLAFSAFPGVGPVKFNSLLKKFGSASAAWRASLGNLKNVVGEKTSERFDKFRKEFSIERYVRRLENKEVQFLILTDQEYPELLKEIKNPPFVIYVKGNKEILHFVQDDIDRIIAVVGTRKITNYGREVTEFLVRDLVAAELTIVSGLALGIDSVAHRTAVENGGKTIAVLGCGVDCCIPKENEGLYNSIIKSGGLILSEFPLSQIPTKGSFPSRNRIIAGLSLGVLVTEGAEDSGSLITADYAFKFGRKVFAVPGPITSSLSKGPHSLLSKGAKMVTRGEDIINELGIMNYELGKGIKGRKSIRSIKGSKEEETILKILENEQLHIDEIVRRCGFGAAKTSELLSIMEVKGYVRDVGGGIFSLAR